MVLVVTRFENDEGLCQNWPSGARILTFMIIAKVLSFLCILVCYGKFIRRRFFAI